MFRESRDLLLMCSFSCTLVFIIKEHYINLSPHMHIYIRVCYIYFIFIFHDICTVSIVSAYCAQGFMTIGNICIALTLYICPCKTEQAKCQILLLEQTVVLKIFLESHCNYKLQKQKLSSKICGVTQQLTQFRPPESLPKLLRANM